MILVNVNDNEAEVMTKDEFSLLIETHSEENGLPLVNGIINLCEIYDIDFSQIPKMITDDMKTKIAISEHLETAVFGKTAKLPI